MPNTIMHVIVAILAWLCIIVFTLDFSISVLLLLVLANLIDIDHLLARPIYDANRKSIGFHVLHKKRLFVFYVAGCFLPTPYSFFFVGILLHLFLDYLEWVHPFSVILHKPHLTKSLDRLLKRF